MPRITRPSTKARRRRDTQFRRDGILAAATSVFLEEGYQGATTDRIASRAGVSVGTVYNACGSKERVYADVVEAIGREMVAYMESTVTPLSDPDRAVQVLVRFRLANFDRHRLLLVLFSSERGPGAYPNLEGVSDEPKNLYYSYLHHVARIFERGMDQCVFERMHPLHLALSFEGVLGAFVGYWLRPGQEGHLEAQARDMADAFLKMAGAKRVPSTTAALEHEAHRREIFVTSFDVSRLRELIAVARTFGSAENAAHLDELETELKGSRIVEPTAVPRDVVTMNSRVRLRQLPSGESRLCALAFPVDANGGDDSISVLSPLGTALLGHRVGAVVEADGAGDRVRCEVAELLYQPEAAGDFHR